MADDAGRTLDLVGRVSRDRVWIAAALLLVGVALPLDHAVAAWADHWKLPVLDALVGVINPIGSGVTLLVVSVALALLARCLGRSRLHDASWLAAVAFAFAGLVEFSLKHLVGPPRPDVDTALVASFDSFPSGHATSVFTVAAVFAAYYPVLRWPLYGLAAAIALGRVYLDRHYVSDIVAGAVIGLTLAVYLYRERHRRAFLRRLILERAADRSR
jgi:undecaprenyl-diphosphatase